MGKEAVARVRRAGKTWQTKVLLETDEIVVRGDGGFKVPLRSIKKADVRDGWLVLSAAGGPFEIDLGAQAPRWADAVLHPKTLVEKLGVKAGQRVRFLAFDDEGLKGDLAGVGAKVVTRGEADVVFLGANVKKDLVAVGRIESSLARTGAIWIVYPKGREDIREADVFEAGHAAGLTDVKVARFSATHTALKFVIPVSRR